jgi:hypothetical protein
VETVISTFDLMNGFSLLQVVFLYAILIFSPFFLLGYFLKPDAEVNIFTFFPMWMLVVNPVTQIGFLVRQTKNFFQIFYIIGFILFIEILISFAIFADIGKIRITDSQIYITNSFGFSMTNPLIYSDISGVFAEQSHHNLLVLRDCLKLS